jgi:hypothetical protein
MLGRQDPVTQIRWMGFMNASAGTIPAFGAMNISGVDVTTGLVLVDGAPTADNQDALFNGDVREPAGKHGIATRDYPLYALYHVADGTPTAGQEWGCASGSFELRSGKTGFRIWGGVTSGRVKVAGIVGTSGGGGGGGTGFVTDSSLVYLTAPVTVGVAADVTVSWDAANWDTFGSWPGTGGNTQITALNAGVTPAYSYQIGAQIAWALLRSRSCPPAAATIFSTKPTRSFLTTASEYRPRTAKTRYTGSPTVSPG